MQAWAVSDLNAAELQAFAKRGARADGFGRTADADAVDQIATSWRTPCASMSLPRPRAMTSPRSITR